MIIVAIDFRGNYYFEILDKNDVLNAERYSIFLENLVEEIDKCKFVIMHDNARPHKANIITKFLKSNKIIAIKQPPYSLDLNLLDRFVFRNMETKR